MATTALDLFRNGNASGARLDHVRPGRDVDVWPDTTGQVWVRANGKGVSTWDAPDPNWSQPWRLPAGAAYSNDLMLWNDMPGHWLFVPARDILLSDYVAALAAVNAQFVKV